MIDWVQFDVENQQKLPRTFEHVCTFPQHFDTLFVWEKKKVAAV